MNNKYTKGFTLMEILVVVAIVAILTSVAISSYSGNIISSRRTDGRSALLNTANSLEKCRATYGSYNNINCNIKNGDSIDSPEQYYTVAVTTAARTFNLTANPVSGKSQEKDTDCTSITLDNLSRQSGSGAFPETCW